MRKIIKGGSSWTVNPNGDKQSFFVATEFHSDNIPEVLGDHSFWVEEEALAEFARDVVETFEGYCGKDGSEKVNKFFRKHGNILSEYS